MLIKSTMDHKLWNHLRIEANRDALAVDLKIMVVLLNSYPSEI